MPSSAPVESLDLAAARYASHARAFGIDPEEAISAVHHHFFAR